MIAYDLQSDYVPSSASLFNYRNSVKKLYTDMSSRFVWNTKQIMLNLPPSGAANVQATPTAQAAASISLVRDSF